MIHVSLDPALLQQHRTMVHAFILASVWNRADAEDLLQETLMEASRGGFTSGNFGAWIREIARRRILEHARKTKRRAELAQALRRLEEAAGRLGPPDERREALRHCLSHLTQTGRTVMDGRYQQKQPIPAIARAIGKTVQATYAILKRVRQAVRECVERRLRGEATT